MHAGEDAAPLWLDDQRTAMVAIKGPAAVDPRCSRTLAFEKMYTPKRSHEQPGR
jgi:hypothetical protein